MAYCRITPHLFSKLNLWFCFFQICCSTDWSTCLGNECHPHWCTRYSVYYIWQRVDWNLSWLVRVFKHLSSNLWSTAFQLSLQKSYTKVEQLFGLLSFNLWWLLPHNWYGNFLWMEIEIWKLCFSIWLK